MCTVLLVSIVCTSSDISHGVFFPERLRPRVWAHTVCAVVDKISYISSRGVSLALYPLYTIPLALSFPLPCRCALTPNS